VQTLDGILQALGAADYDVAAKIAVEHLGLDSLAVAACKPKTANAAPPAHGSMDEIMALYMPEQMRAIGLAMHTSASEFAVVATRAAATHDARAAVEALSRVTQNCVVCHAGYRLQ
jgi:mono/diheme cytochrome c family protein